MNLYVISKNYKDFVHWCEHNLFTDRINPVYVSQYEGVIGAERGSYYVKIGEYWEKQIDPHLESTIMERQMVEVNWKIAHWIYKLLE